MFRESIDWYFCIKTTACKFLKLALNHIKQFCSWIIMVGLLCFQLLFSVSQFIMVNLFLHPILCHIAERSQIPLRKSPKSMKAVVWVVWYHYICETVSYPVLFIFFFLQKVPCRSHCCFYLNPMYCLGLYW